MDKKLLSLVLVSLLAACASKPAKEEAAQPAAAAQPEAAQPVPAQPAAETAAAPTAAPAVTPEPAPVAPADTSPEDTSVHFPFDVDAVQPEDVATVQAHGNYLNRHRDAKVRLAGHADERGSSEYNLGLGQRRANNVKKLLILSGAEESQVATVSYGEEKPSCTAHEESCWSQNRRVDFIYQ